MRRWTEGCFGILFGAALGFFVPYAFLWAALLVIGADSPRLARIGCVPFLTMPVGMLMGWILAARAARRDEESERLVREVLERRDDLGP